MISLAFRPGKYVWMKLSYPTKKLVSSCKRQAIIKIFTAKWGPYAFEERIGVNEPIAPNGWPSNLLAIGKEC